MNTATSDKGIAPVVQKFALGDEPSDFAYWQTQPYEARLEALEQIRREYHGWTDETQPRVVRVRRVVKR